MKNTLILLAALLTATATVLLPIACPDVDERSLVQIDAELRAHIYHPEKYLDTSDPAIGKLVREKREWIGRGGSDGNLKQRHDAIRGLNQRLYALLVDHVAGLRERRIQVLEDIQRAKILASREYSFVLFPDSLIEQLHSLAVAAN